MRYVTVSLAKVAIHKDIVIVVRNKEGHRVVDLHVNGILPNKVFTFTFMIQDDVITLTKEINNQTVIRFLQSHSIPFGLI